MTDIAFFADDETGPLCALMTAMGLSEIGVRTVVATPPGAVRAGYVPPPGLSLLELDWTANAFEVERAARVAARAGADLVAALPLSRIGDAAVRPRFDAVVTVGGGHAAAARAMRAARYDVSDSGRRGHVPAWFLARADQPLLATKARLRSATGPRLPFSTRTLPYAMPPLTHAEGDALRAWMPGGAVLGGGVLLAALCLAVAAEPFATDLSGGDLADMMAVGTPSPTGGISARLRDLARLYEGIVGEPVRECRPYAAARSRDRRVRLAGAARPTREVAFAPNRRVIGA